MAYQYDGLGRLAVRTETFYDQKPGVAWGRDKNPGEAAAPSSGQGRSGVDQTKGNSDKGAASTKGNGKAGQAALDCPEGTVAVETAGNGQGNGQGKGKGRGAAHRFMGKPKAPPDLPAALL